MVKIKPSVNQRFYSEKYKEYGVITRIVNNNNVLNIAIKYITDNKETICVTANKLLYNISNNSWYFLNTKEFK